MRKHYISIFIFLIAAGMSAQQLGMVNHFFYKPFVYNPAFAGSTLSTQAMMIHRSQWTDFNNAPQLNIFTLDGAVNGNKVGLGVSLINEKRGINKRTGASLAYSYRLHIGESATLALGLSAGIIDHMIDFSKARAEDYTDPSLFYQPQHKAGLDLNAGLAFVWKGLELGVSVPQFAGNKINYNDDTSGVRAIYHQARHIASSVKYKIPLNEEKGISVAPVFLSRITSGAPFQFDGGINFEWKDKFWIGGLYKNGYGVAANVGVCLHKQLSIGYSYDVIMSNIKSYAGLSHEIMVSYKFGGPKKEDHLEEHPKDEELNVSSNPQVEGKIDSLHDQISENERKIRELNTKIEQLSKAVAQQAANASNNNGNGNSSNSNAGGNSDSGNNSGNNNSGNNASTNSGNGSDPSVSNAPANGFNEGKDILVNPRNEYTDRNNKTAQKGFYVIVGTFFYKDFAEAEAKRFLNRGYGSTSIIYSDKKKHHFIHSHRFNDQKSALNKLKEVRNAGYKDAWVIELTD